jgi:hypothetical protein
MLVVEAIRREYCLKMDAIAKQKIVEGRLQNAQIGVRAAIIDFSNQGRLHGRGSGLRSCDF